MITVHQIDRIRGIKAIDLSVSTTLPGEKRRFYLRNHPQLTIQRVNYPSRDPFRG